MYIKKSILYSICLLIFIDAVSSGLIIPILPSLFINKKHGFVITNSYFSREFLYGLSFVIFSVSNIFGMPILGYMADKYGKGKIILYGLIFIILINILCVISILKGSILMFLFCRLLMGFLTGTYSAGMAMISDISKNNEDRMSNFKFANIASLCGILFGPSLSVFINQDYLTNPFIIPFAIVAILSIVNLVILCFNLKRIGMSIFDLLFNFKMTPSKIQSQHIESITSIIKYSLTYILENKSTRRLFVSFFFLQFALGIYIQSLSLLLITAFLYTPQTIGVLMIVNSIVTIVSMYILQPFITRYCKYISQTRVSLGLISLLFILYAIYSIYASHDLEKYKIFSLITLLLANIFLPFITLGFTNLFANSVDKFAQGRIMGGYGQIASLATIISGLVSAKILSVNFSIVIVLSSVALIISYVLLKSYLIHNCRIRKIICQE